MCSSASGWSKLALVVMVIALALHITGWATLYWMHYSNSNNNLEIRVGLWRMDTCNNGNCDETSLASQYETASYNAVRALTTLTFLLAVLITILLIIFACAEMTKRNTFAIVVMVLCYIAGACSFVAMIINIVKVPSPFDVSWSMGLTVIAMTLILIAGTLMIPDAFDDNDYEPEEDYDDYFGNRRRGDTPMSHRKGPPSSRGVTPLAYKGGFRY